MAAGPGQVFGQRPLGIDVSSYQGSADSPPTNIVWTNVRSAGITFAWAKATEGTFYIDADFAYNEAQAKSAGVLIGAYHFAHPDDDTNITGAKSADTEVAYFWNTAKNYLSGGGAYLMPMLDYETAPTNLTQAQSAAWANEWCQQLVNYGKTNGVVLKPVIYTYTSFATSWLTSANTQWPLWMAQYPSSPNPQTGAPSSTSPWSTWAFWQYSSTELVSGIEGEVDEDVFDGTSSGLTTYVIGGPGISTQPASVTVVPGMNVAFSVTATGGGTLTYQWEFNGTNIPGANTNEYTLNNVQTTNAGGYSVAVSNNLGSTLSATAFLSVEGPLTNGGGSVVAPVGMVNWWPGDGNVIDIFGTATGTPQGGLVYVPGENGLAFHFDGTSAIISTGAADLAVPWTVCLWVNRQNSPQTSAGLLEDGTYSLKLEQYNGTREVGLSVLSVGDYIFSPAYTVPAGTWTHLAFVGTSAGTSLYVNGALKGSLTNSIPLPRSYIGAGYISASSKYIDFMRGSLDEIITFSQALTATQINAIYDTGNSGLVRAPEIVSAGLGGNGQFNLNLAGLTGKNFTIYSSTNLPFWTTVETLRNSAGTNQFIDTGVTNNPQKFYQVSQPY